MKLPNPDTKGKVPLETALKLRRSIRSFKKDDLTDQELAQLLWAAQGLTDKQGFRTAPLAGAVYPLEIYVIKEAGVFHYLPETHSLTLEVKEDRRPALAAAASGQNFIIEAPVSLVIAALFKKIEGSYRERARQYTYQESGHVAQNILLQATALGLGGVPVGAFNEKEVNTACTLPAELTPLYIIPIGHF